MPHNRRRPWIRALEGPNDGAATAPGSNSTGASPNSAEDQPSQEGEQPDDGAQEVGDRSGENPDARGSKQSVLADLARERDKRQALQTERDELQAKVAEFERAQMTEAEKAEADRKELETKYADALAKIAAHERTATLTQLATEFKIPAAMADRIQGETPEEMRADAQALAKSLGPYTGPSDPSAGQGGGKPAPATSLDAAIAAHLNR